MLTAGQSDRDASLVDLLDVLDPSPKGDCRKWHFGGEEEMSLENVMPPTVTILYFAFLTNLYIDGRRTKHSVKLFISGMATLL